MLSAEVQIWSGKAAMSFYQQHFDLCQNAADKRTGNLEHSEKCHRFGYCFHSWCGNADHQMVGVVLRFQFQPHYPTCTKLKMVAREQFKKALLSACLLEHCALTRCTKI